MAKAKKIKPGRGYAGKQGKQRGAAEAKSAQRSEGSRETDPAFMQQFFEGQELQSKDRELQNLITHISQPNITIDFNSKFDFASRRSQNKLTDEEQKKLDEDERIVAEKLAEVASKRKPINFFIPPIAELLKHSKSSIYF